MMAVLWLQPYGPVAALLVLLPMCVSWWVFTQYHRERAAHQATIRALVQAVDIGTATTRGHSERVGQASVLITRELGMDDERVEMLRFAGILHDVANWASPPGLLRRTARSPRGRRIIELHPEYGHEWSAALLPRRGRRHPPPPRTARRQRLPVTAWPGTASPVRPDRRRGRRTSTP